MTNSGRANARMRNLLLFGLAAVALTVLPPFLPLPPTVAGLLPVIGRFGLAFTLVGLVLSFLTLNAHLPGERGEPVSARRNDPATSQLPVAARAMVARLCSQLDALAALVAGNPVMTEAAFTIGEMRATYLPATIDAYLAIPALQRPQHAAHLMEQLQLLETAAADLAERCASDRGTALHVNGRFLADRFRR
jgi:hypothetical protein